MKAIFAIDAAGGYAHRCDLPWKFGDYPDDSNFYINQTRGKTLIMGRGTWESYSGMQTYELAKRSIVISSDETKVAPVRRVSVDYEKSTKFSTQFKTSYYKPTVKTMDTFKREFIDLRNNGNCIIIGGAQLICELIGKCYITELYLTKIPHIHKADKFTNMESIADVVFERKEVLAETKAGIKIMRYYRR